MNKFDSAMEKSILALTRRGDFLSYPVHTVVALSPKNSPVQAKMQKYSNPCISYSCALTAKSSIEIFNLLNSYFCNLHKFY